MAQGVLISGHQIVISDHWFPERPHYHLVVAVDFLEPDILDVYEQVVWSYQKLPFRTRDYQYWNVSLQVGHLM